MSLITFIISLLALLAAAAKMSRDLMMLQQNSYRDERYAHWLKESGDSTSFDRLFALAVLFLCMCYMFPASVAVACAGVFSVWMSARLLRAKYKKPLVWTSRAKRIYAVAIALTLIAAVAVCYLMRLCLGNGQWPFIAMAVYIAAYAGSSYLLRAANWTLKPVEARINKRYCNEAASILRSMPGLKVIGITGSYGKTSTKHYLHRILSEKYDVLMTPGNFNTTLGVVRTVRERLKPYNEVFICEMGAKQPGDIKEICDLAHPSIGIVTAVGPMHLETFGSIDLVQATKFELVDALPADGLAVVNNDFKPIADRPVANVECLRYSVSGNAGARFTAKDVKYDAHGASFTICDDGKEVITLRTRLVGECNISNLIAAVVVALRLGVEPEKIRYAVEKIEQVEHRLNMKRLPSGITIIDDAYNSNPIGSKMALDVLAQMTGGTRIVITPGMIELGDDQERLNRDLGAHIARSTDVAIIVGEYNRQAILDGIRQAGMPEDSVHAVASFAEAQALMLSLAKAGDTVLYENDLPDTFK